MADTFFAEITIQLPVSLLVQEAEKIAKNLQEGLINQIKNLKFVVIQIASHKVAEGFIRPRWGRGFRWRWGWEKREKIKALKKWAGGF